MTDTPGLTIPLSLEEVEAFCEEASDYSNDMILRVALQLLAAMQREKALSEANASQQQTLEAMVRRMERLRAALEEISFASRGTPAVVDGEEVPEKWQSVMRQHFRRMGEAAEEALAVNQPASNEDTEGTSEGSPSPVFDNAEDAIAWLQEAAAKED